MIFAANVFKNAVIASKIFGTATKMTDSSDIKRMILKLDFFKDTNEWQSSSVLIILYLQR